MVLPRVRPSRGCMSERSRKPFVQLVTILLVTGVARSAWHARTTPAADLPGVEASLDLLADSAAKLAGAEARRTRPMEAGERLDPNRASEEELDRLPGIGPATARAIVAARDSLPFGSPEEIVRVRGIGASTLEKLRPFLEVARAPGRPGPLRRGSGSPTRPGSGRVTGEDRASDIPPIDVNRAGPDELQSLPGVGPVLADRIVADRARAGRYRKPEDLLRVRGIGPALLERLRPRIRL